MIDADWPASLDEDELAELDTYLREHAGEDRLLLDGVHGLLTVLAIGPRPAKPEEWLSEVLHDTFIDPEQGERVLTLLARLNDSVIAEIETGSYEPILGELDGNAGSPAFSARGWCDGFSRGIDLRASDWESRLGHDPDLMQILGPIVALSIDDGVFDSDAGFAPLGDEEYDECLARIPEAVGALAAYWQEHPPQPVEGGPENVVPPRWRGGRSVH